MAWPLDSRLRMSLSTCTCLGKHQRGPRALHGILQHLKLRLYVSTFLNRGHRQILVHPTSWSQCYLSAIPHLTGPGAATTTLPACPPWLYFLPVLKTQWMPQCLGMLKGLLSLTLISDKVVEDLLILSWGLTFSAIKVLRQEGHRSDVMPSCCWGPRYFERAWRK